MTNKPREWFIDPDKFAPRIAESGETRKWEGVHVIEYSYAQALEKESDGARAALEDRDNMHEEHIKAYKLELLKLSAERNQLKAERDAFYQRMITALADAHQYSKERDSLRAKLEVAREALKQINATGNYDKMILSYEEERDHLMELARQALAKLEEK